MDLNSLTSDSQFLREWVCQKGEKKWSIDACLYSYHLYLSGFSVCVCVCFFFFFFLHLLPFVPPPFSLFTATPFYTIYHGGIYHFYPSTILSFFLYSFFVHLLPFAPPPLFTFHSYPFLYHLPWWDLPFLPLKYF